MLATGVAHEIHNPLSSIELALSAIRDTLSNEHEPSGAQHYIDIARTEIGKCMGVTESLMRLSEPPREPELVILNAVLREVVQLLAYQIGTGQIVVHIDLAQKLRIIASDSDMRMIFINLIQNAIHAMPQGGELRVSGQTLGGFAVLRVADTGIGIPNEHLDKIFLPFWTRRADGSTGRGLGLSICKAIVERYGGAISVDSIPGKGSEFTVALPAADAPKTAATRAKAGAGAGDRG
ncbi:MAG TPA: ATP-binding protein [Rhizobiaceae bacterium]|nr:ATP-binding protein [Rhizobiaceae bacterium]